jgi:hypothetical protein
MEDFNTPVYAQAKIEYTKQLKDVLMNPMYNKMFYLYQESKKIYANNTHDSVFNIFREKIQDIPKWNNDMIEDELLKIIETSRCDWLEDLVTAVFISHTKVLASIGNSKYNKKINLTIPVLTNFIHKCYINFAREIWKNPFLFDENQSSSDYQNNIKTIEELIKESIDLTIRKLLPVKEILRDHLEKNNDTENDNDEDEVENDEEEKEKLKTKNLQKILMSEIMNLRKEKHMENLQQQDEQEEERYFDDDVDENTILKNTQNIEIHDILNESKPENNIEPIYDNPNIIDRESVDDSIVSVEEKLNGYKNMKPNVVKIDEEPINDVKITDEPVKITDEPIKITDEPINITDEPINITDEPINITDEPINITDEPINKETPINITDEPIKITDEPINITDEPIKITDEPITKETPINIDNTNNIIKDIENTLENSDIKTIQTGGKKLNDETMTLDNFLDDVDNMVSNNTETNNDYTLFNDANDI